MSLHHGRKQLLQHQQSVLKVQRSVAHLRQELQARTQLLQVSTPSIFTWPLGVTPVILGGKSLALGDCAEVSRGRPVEAPAEALWGRGQTSKLWQLLQNKGGRKALWEVGSLAEGREGNDLAGRGPGYHSDGPSVGE